MSLGPCVFVDPALIASQPMPALEKGQSLFLLRFDDHVMHLTRDEDVDTGYRTTSRPAKHAAGHAPVDPAGWDAGAADCVERPAKSSGEVPRWQAVQCVVEARQNSDRITGQPQSI